MPWFIFPLCVATALILIAAGIPLARRKVPPNSFYGVRLPATLRSERVWFEVNAIAGRHLIRVGALYLGCLLIAQLIFPGIDPALRILGPVVVLVVSLLVETIVIVRVTRQIDRGS